MRWQDSQATVVQELDLTLGMRQMMLYVETLLQVVIGTTLLDLQ